MTEPDHKIATGCIPIPKESPSLKTNLDLF